MHDDLTEKFLYMLRDRCGFPESEAMEQAKAFQPYLDAPFQLGHIHATEIFSYVPRHESLGISMSAEHMRGRLTLFAAG